MSSESSLPDFINSSGKRSSSPGIARKAPARWTVFAWRAWRWTAALVISAIVLTSFHYLVDFLISGEVDYEFAMAEFPTVIFLVHTIFAGVALAVGGLQFWPGLRRSNPELHKLTGKIYLGSVALSGLSAMPTAWASTGGPVANSGFTMLGVLWLLTTLVAYAAIRQRDIQRHRRWMVRSYALALVSLSFRVMLLLYGPIAAMTGLNFDAYFAVGIWVATLVNLSIAEFVIGPPLGRSVKTTHTNLLRH